MSFLIKTFLPFTIILIGIYVFQILWKRWKLISQLSWISGPPALPILGNYFDLIAPPPEVAFETMTKYNKKYGRTYKVWIGTSPAIHCQDLDIIKEVFKTDNDVSRPAMYIMIRHFLGPGLLFGEGGEKWKIQRKHLSESFHTEILDDHLQTVGKKMKSLTWILEKECQKSQPIDLIYLLKAFFLDVTVYATAGVENNSLEKPLSCSYLDAVEKMSEIVMARLFSPIMKYNFLFNWSHLKKIDEVAKNAIDTFVSNAVEERREIIKATPEVKKRKIIADAMFELQNSMQNVISKEDINNQLSNNIFASYDTLGTSTSYLLFLLANNPKIQDECVEEIQRFAPNIETQGITVKESSNLQLLERCVKEALRMFPPAPFIGRRINNPIHTSKGTIPAGVDLYINMYNYHMNEEVYPNPGVFDPDRFLPENVSQRHPSTWMPFGLGIRTCIGQKQALIKMKITAAMIMKKFIVKPYENVKDLKLIANVILKSRDGIRVYLEPRI